MENEVVEEKQAVKPSDSTENENDNYENFFNPELFVCTDYKVSIFEHKGVQQPIYALTHGSPDFDMTGQHVWEGGEVLAKFIIENSELFKGKNIIELGSGTGLTGLVASQYAKITVLTDYIPEVMDLLEKNIIESKHRSEDHQIAYAVLDWEHTKYEDISIKTVYDYNGVVEEQSINIQDFGKFDMIIAAEVIYWESSIIPLMTIVDELFTKQNDELVFYLIFLKRSTRLHDQLLEAFEKYNFTYELIDDPLTHHTAQYK